MDQKTILIVEDSYSSLLLMDHTLRFSGYLTQLASGVKEAIEIIHSKIPDLIILDLNMPEITGYDFLKMRDDLNIKKIPVIVVSALDSQDSIDYAKGLGASYLIPKPVKLDLVNEKIKELLKISYPILAIH